MDDKTNIDISAAAATPTVTLDEIPASRKGGRPSVYWNILERASGLDVGEGFEVPYEGELKVARNRLNSSIMNARKSGKMDTRLGARITSDNRLFIFHLGTNGYAHS